MLWLVGRTASVALLVAALPAMPNTANAGNGDAASSGSRGSVAGCSFDDPSQIDLGMATLPAIPVPAARKGYEDAEKAYSLKQYRRARDLLAPALTTNPGYADATYLLALVNVRLGDGEAACEVLRPLLERDLPVFSVKVRTDPELAGFRTTLVGQRLLAHIDRLSPVWKSRVQKGLPSILWAGTRDDLDVVTPQVMRAGVYLHPGRFLAMDRGTPGATAALVDPRRSRLVTVRPNVAACRDSGCPRITSAEVFMSPLDSWEVEPKKWSYEGGAGKGLDLRSADDGGWVQVQDCCCWKGCRSPWFRLGREGDGETSAKPRPDGVRLEVDYRGAGLSLVPAGFSVNGGRLRGPRIGSVTLSTEHRDADAVHTVLQAKDGTELFVLSVVDTCRCKESSEGAVLTHVGSIVNVATKRSRAVMKGIGSAAAALGGDGALYIQDGDTLRRWPQIGKVGQDAGEPVMPGVLLVPARRPLHNCCGL